MREKIKDFWLLLHNFFFFPIQFGIFFNSLS